MPSISIRGIGSPTPVGSAITKVEVEYAGQVTTEVPEGERFLVNAWGIGMNPGAYSWEVLFTMISNDGTIACYNSTDVAGEKYQTPGFNPVKVTARNVSGMEPIMPNHDITLLVKLWGNDTKGQNPPSDLNEWAIPV